ncbi:glycosyltransferase [Acidithiobacillus sp. MC6.1]|nr:glycosyltransferase [Acidithiobacillus sp. MC6.1]
MRAQARSASRIISNAAQARPDVWGGGRVSYLLGITRHICRPVADDRLDYLTGASLLLRREAIEAVGLFDTSRFFLYWEDTDYGLRLRRAGWQLAVAKDALVWHDESSSLGAASPQKDRYVAASSVRFYRKYAAFPVVPILIGNLGRMAQRLMRGEPRRVLAVASGVWRGWSNPKPVFPEQKPLRVAVESMTLLSPHAGIGRYTAQMAAMLRMQVDVQVDYFFGPRWQCVEPQALPGQMASRLAGIRNALPGGRAATQILQNLAVYRHGRRYRPDVIFAPNYGGPHTKVPVVPVVHDLSHLRYPEMHPASRVSELTRRLGRSLEKASVVLADSRFTADEIAHFYPKAASKVRVIYPGVDARFFDRTLGDAMPADLAALLGSPPPRYLLALATLEPRKNVARLLEAYAGLPDAVRSAYPLFLVGQMGWNTSTFAQLLQKLVNTGQVQLLGYVPDDLLPDLYRHAWVLLYPSLYEGFGLPPVEAMASGCQVLVSGVSAMPEVCGDAAIRVDPMDIESIRQGILRITLDEALRMDLKARGVARAGRYRWESAGESLLEVLRAASGMEKG